MPSSFKAPVSFKRVDETSGTIASKITDFVIDAPVAKPPSAETRASITKVSVFSFGSTIRQFDPTVSASTQFVAEPAPSWYG